MAANLIARAETTIDAPASEVWKAITTPEIVSEYLFGTHVETDWRVGSPIRFTGSYQGKSYEDKGTILQNLPEKILQMTYLSSNSGLEDKPENYFNVSYELEEENNKTHLLIRTENLPNEKARDHAEKNWQGVVEKLKEVVERRKTASPDTFEIQSNLK